ncbi:MAG: cardiolipin synthase [Pirellulaceae bacterium]|nr:cardiolipin synthase [Pirellulaceae bacterium]
MSTELIFLLHSLFVFAFIIRALARPHRDPASRIAWVAIIAALPLVGILAYVLFGETNIGKQRIAKTAKIIAGLPKLSPAAQNKADIEVPQKYQPLFETGKSINKFEVMGGNSGQLMGDSNQTIESMIVDIDAAKETVHLSFYIWLADQNGVKMMDALKRAAARGVKCRAIADHLGSRDLIRSNYWKDMKQAGVDLAVALPIRNLFMQILVNRIDLRNHRKILIVDNCITYCGSQNCADPEFRVKAKYAPWVDAMIRFQGPIVRQNQHLFVSDWMSSTDDDIADILSLPLADDRGGFPAQVIGTGPTVRFSAMPEMFESLFYAARRELIISTPYYVPDVSIQNALCSAAWRGVKTKVIFPAKNDSWIVGGASRSYYHGLLEAGVEIHEYQGGLLHTKSLTLDGVVTLIGSANMDRRSFDLNYENNILFYDPKLTHDVRQRQEEYLQHSKLITLDEVEAWPFYKSVWNNTLATLGPIL